MFDALVGAVGIVAEAGADAGYFVGGDAGADAAAADDDAAFGVPGGDGAGHGGGEVGVVVLRVEGVGAEVVDLMAGGGEPGFEGFFEGKAGVVGAEGDTHSGRLQG